MSVRVGVFVRADHPEGWGYGSAQRPGRAHGYVVLFVRSGDEEQMQAVANHLAREPFAGVPGTGQYNEGHLGEWFGGRFDHIATVPDVDVPYGPFQVRGDNRMVAIFDAADVLASGDHGTPAAGQAGEPAPSTGERS